MGEESYCHGNLTTWGQKQKRNGISGPRPPKNLQTPISACFSESNLDNTRINRALSLLSLSVSCLSFFCASFQSLTKSNACLHKYSIHMPFPNRIGTKAHTSFSKSGSQLISFKALSLHEISNCPVGFYTQHYFLTCSLQTN